MTAGGTTYGIVGALEAFPRRLANRVVTARGQTLLRSITRQTTDVVFGRSLLDRWRADAISAKAEALAAQKIVCRSELQFLYLLGLAKAPPRGTVSAASLCAQARLDPRDFRMLALFDCFEGADPMSFADLIAAKKYASLIAEGASWIDVARSVRASQFSAIVKQSVTRVGGRDYALHDGALFELNGQSLLLAPDETDGELDSLFAAAEEAEAEARFAEAAALYRQCLALDPADPIATFNLANCLSKLEATEEASLTYAKAIKLDAKLVEAWLNHAYLLRKLGRLDGARYHLEEALRLDPDYGDAIYNLAALEYDTGRLVEARQLWSRYLEIDSASEWARTATRGIQFVDIELNARKAAS